MKKQGFYILGLTYGALLCYIIVFKFKESLTFPPKEQVDVPKDGHDDDDDYRTIYMATTPEPNPLQYNANWTQVCRCKVITRSLLFGQVLNKTHPLVNETIGKYLNHHHPNLPITLLDQPSSCARLPKTEGIKWNSRIWQVLETSSKTRYYFYAAYYDNRNLSDPKPSVRILALVGNKIDTRLYCELWFKANGSTKVRPILRAERIDWQSKTVSGLMPYLFTCPLTPDEVSLKPIGVSVAQTPCRELTNVLKVIDSEEGPTSYRRPDPQLQQWPVGVCGQGLFYSSDFSTRLVDWAETLKAMGVSKIFLYVTDVHPSISRVLHYYSQEEKFISLVSFTYPEPYIDQPELRRYWTLVSRSRMFAMENIYFSDCILRNMATFRFLMRADLDEVPIISDGLTLPGLISSLLNQYQDKPPPSYALHVTMFHEDLPPGPKAMHLPNYAFILRHNYRYRDIRRHGSPGFYKPICDTDQTTGIFSHNVLFCGNGYCGGRGKHVSYKRAFMAHYRRNCNQCDMNKMEEETRLLSYQPVIINNTDRVLRRLGLV